MSKNNPAMEQWFNIHSKELSVNSTFPKRFLCYLKKKHMEFYDFRAGNSKVAQNYYYYHLNIFIMLFVTYFEIVYHNVTLLCNSLIWLVTKNNLLCLFDPRK